MLPQGVQAGWRTIKAVLMEAGWWLSGLGRLVRRHRLLALLLVSFLVMAVLLDHRDAAVLVAAVVLLPVVAMALWARLGPVSYERWVSAPIWRRKTGRALRLQWPELMQACGLSRHVPARQNAGEVQVPAMRRLGWAEGQLMAEPGLLVGQTIDDFEDAAERLRVSLQASRVRIVPNETLTGCRIVWSFGDPLAARFDAAVPRQDAPVPELTAVTVGRTEDGAVWRWPLGVSTLTAGSSGSGKASLIWGLMFGLGPAIRTGLVQVHGIDLKGGMELSMGRPLFTRYADRAEQAVVLLEDAAQALQARAARLAGHTRQHTPSTADPLVLVLIDELAALVAYLPDRDLTRRAEAALNVVLSQGRAVGFFVFAFLQDPRKETVKMRHLFTQSLGLRLRDREEVAMVLGDGALAAGATCHKIARSTPGVGFVLSEDDGRPVKVRAGYVSDEMIRTCAARFPAPYQLPVVVPDPEPRRPRARRSSRAASTAEGEAA